MIPPRRQQIEEALSILAPAMLPKDRHEVIEHALWSKGLRKASPQAATWLSLVAYLRHAYTDYDQLLSEGYSHEQARYFCMRELENVLERIGCKQMP